MERVAPRFGEKRHLQREREREAQFARVTGNIFHPLTAMSDAEDGVIPNSQNEEEEDGGFGLDTYEAGIIRKVELINFMCHSYAPLLCAPFLPLIDSLAFECRLTVFFG